MWVRFKKSVQTVGSYVLIDNNKWRIAGGFLTSAASSVFNFGANYLAAETFSMLAMQQKSTTLFGMETEFDNVLGLACGTYILSRITSNCSNIILARVAPIAFKELVIDFGGHSLRSGSQDKLNEGTKTTYLQKGCAGVSNLAGQFTSQLPTVVSIAGSAVLSANSFGGFYGGVLLGAAAGCTVFNVYNATKIVNLRTAARDASNESFDDLMRAIDNPQVIQAAGRVDYEMKRIALSQDKMEKAESDTSRFNSIASLIQETGLGCIYAGMTVYGAYQVNAGQLPLAAFGTMQLLLTNFLSSYHSLGMAVLLSVASGSDAANVFDYLRSLPSVINYCPNEHLVLTSKNNSIEFKEVKFKHKEKEKEEDKEEKAEKKEEEHKEQKPEFVLDGIDFFAAAGEIIGLVGESGSGKTTCAAMIPRFIDSTEGQILIGGKDIKTFSLDSLRKYIGIIEQEPILLGGMTIFDNIAYGSPNYPNVDRREVYEAAEQAGALQFILGLKKGFDTKLETGGSNLSGGQKQRIAIARAFIKKPLILICDEATSALDARTALGIQNTIKRIAKQNKMIVILISHFMRDLIKADKIFVFDKGKIVERGVHSQLVGIKEGVYAKLWDDQNKELDEKQSLSASKQFDSSSDYSPGRLFQPAQTDPSRIVTFHLQPVQQAHDEVVIDIPSCHSRLCGNDMEI